MAKRAVAPRVTYAEQAARAFFRWGYFKRPIDDLPKSYPQRVAWIHRWPNLWGQDDGGTDNKLIDFTGCGGMGMSIVCETKTWDTRQGRRFRFDQISPKQEDFLTRHPGWAFLWLGAIVPSQDRRRENWRMFLIPWPEWQHMQENHVRRFKSGGERLWRAISLPWVVYWFGQYELVEHPYREDNTLKRAWFTQVEMNQVHTTWTTGYPPALPLPWIIRRDDRPEPEEK